MENLYGFFGSMDIFEGLTSDALVLGVFFFLSFALGAALGRRRLAGLLFGSYIASVVAGALSSGLVPFGMGIGPLVFLVVAALSAVFGRKIFGVSFSAGGSMYFLRLFLASVLVCGFIVSQFISLFPPKDISRYISGNAYGLFASEMAVVLWAVAPLATFFILKINWS